jgi:hypothetical protein
MDILQKPGLLSYPKAGKGFWPFFFCSGFRVWLIPKGLILDAYFS